MKTEFSSGGLISIGRVVLFSAILGLGVYRVAAEDQVRAAQEELRKRNLYFGNIDGQPSDATKAALVEYQKRKGFSASGELDEATLSSLGLPANTPLPAGPVLRSDVGLTKSERNALKAQAPAADSTVRAGAESEEPPPVTEQLDVPPPGARLLPRRQQESTRQAVQQFLENAASNRPSRELSHYAPTVDYLNHGKVSREFIRKDIQRYQSQWGQRQYQLVDSVSYANGRDAETITVKFRAGFSLANRRGVRATGQTNNLITFQQVGNELRIVVIKEQRVNPHTPTRSPFFFARLMHSIAHLFGCLEY